MLREFLQGHLPQRYGVAHGEVVAATGEASREVDVLVYDSFLGQVLVGSDSSQLLAAESVYAAIEVKPRLTAAGLEAAVVNIRAVKALSRRAIMRPWDPLGQGTAPEENPPIFGGIFSFGGMALEQLARRLRQHHEGVPPSLWVDCACILDRGVVYRYMPGPSGWSEAASRAPTPLACVEAGDDSLLLFWLLLLQDVNAKTLLPPELMQYALGLWLPEATLV